MIYWLKPSSPGNGRAGRTCSHIWPPSIAARRPCTPGFRTNCLRNCLLEANNLLFMRFPLGNALPGKTEGVAARAGSWIETPQDEYKIRPYLFPVGRTRSIL